MKTVTLNNGVRMPILGFGVYQIPEDQTEQAVTEALAAGYRSIDTAAAYQNEEAVGRAIRNSGVARDLVLAAGARDFCVEWETLADDLAAALRVEAGRRPSDRALNALIGDLATGSPEFSVRWARHNVRFNRSAR